MEEFKKLGLSDHTINAIKKKGFVKPTQIQEMAIPILLKGNIDLVAQAQTGTGKTASFALPILEIAKPGAGHVQAIVLTPTRELALQVSQDFESLGDKRMRVLAIYGGASITRQIHSLRHGVDIVVGTPGRIMDLMDRGNLDISKVDFVVLDEADEMLDMGFLDDMKKILRKTGREKRMLMFSATMPRELLEIAKTFMREHKIIKTEELMVRLTEHVRYDINPKDRYEALRRIILVNPDFYGLIFCQTRSEVDSLTQNLVGDNYRAAALHGDFSQGQREAILIKFKTMKTKILVATDVAARGIDIEDITHVINYSIPRTAESYVHRVGRTGRAGKKGVAITFVIPSESRRLRHIEQYISQVIEKRALPSSDEVGRLKKSQIKSIIEKIIEKNNSEFDPIVKDLLENNPPEKVIAAVLRYAFKEQMDSIGRKDISKVVEHTRDSSREGRQGRFDRKRRPFNRRPDNNARDKNAHSRPRDDHSRKHNKSKGRPDKERAFGRKKH
ncbi:MAG: DEAD/DEAH box helicase [Candidatus Woesearchaeota archaeon]